MSRSSSHPASSSASESSTDTESSADDDVEGESFGAGILDRPGEDEDRDTESVTSSEDLPHPVSPKKVEEDGVVRRHMEPKLHAGVGQDDDTEDGEELAQAADPSTPPPNVEAEIDDNDLNTLLNKIAPIRRQDLRWLFLVLITMLGIAVVFLLDYAQAVFLPIFLAWTFNLLLSPVVRILRHYRVPSFIGAILCLLLVMVVMGTILMQLTGPAGDYAQRLDGAKAEIKTKFSEIFSFISQTQDAAEEISTATEDESDPEATEVQVKTENTFLSDLLAGMSVATATIVSTLILLFFLLADGDRFLEKILELVPDYERKWKVVEIARSVERGISSYLLSITAINIGLGVTIGLAMYWFGMPSPILWGCMATLLNFIPYFGAIIGVCVVTLVAVAEPSFSTLHVASVAVIYFGCTSIEGNFVTPSVLGYRFNLNPTFIFISLLFWGWLWGVGGALLAVPILAAIKITCDHIERLQPIGAFLVK